MTNKRTLTLIGCGKVGKTLGRLFSDSGSFTILDIVNRSAHSATTAAEFIGAGQVATRMADLRPADIYLIATPDDLIEHSCDALATSGILAPNSIVFHCSGALSTEALHSAVTRGAKVASIHPIRSFADPEQLIHHFAGTYCGAEGDQEALDVLDTGFAAIGASLVAIDGNNKVLYHAAAVFASNYLVTLLDLAQQTYIQAGVAPDMALTLMEPLVLATAKNVFALGPATALTGPVARGDIATVERQHAAVSQWSPANGQLYQDLARLTADLVARQKLPL